MRVGRYELIRPVAAGGMAVVYLGRAAGAAGFEREVAIKVMHPHLAANDHFVTLFLDEARMAANLRHPNVVPTLDVAQDDENVFLVMEYIEGYTLAALRKLIRQEKKKMPLPVALRIVLDVLAGLDAAHELTTPDGQPMNLVHRDISPRNVLVGKSGVARIMDFGVARAETRLGVTQEKGLKGTLQYMAPEQIMGKPFDHRIDIYSVGVILWELLASKPLFRGKTEAEILHKVLQGPNHSPSKLNRDGAPPLDKVCMRALSRFPLRRYQTAAQLAEALEEAAAASKIAIATPRGVSAFLKELPEPKEDFNLERFHRQLEAARQAGSSVEPSANDTGEFSPVSYEGDPARMSLPSITDPSLEAYSLESDSLPVPPAIVLGGAAQPALAGPESASKPAAAEPLDHTTPGVTETIITTLLAARSPGRWVAIGAAAALGLGLVLWLALRDDIVEPAPASSQSVVVTTVETTPPVSATAAQPAPSATVTATAASLSSSASSSSSSSASSSSSSTTTRRQSTKTWRYIPLAP